jgi:hypothetical protein
MEKTLKTFRILAFILTGILGTNPTGLGSESISEIDLMTECERALLSKDSLSQIYGERVAGLLQRIIDPSDLFVEENLSESDIQRLNDMIKQLTTIGIFLQTQDTTKLIIISELMMIRDGNSFLSAISKEDPGPTVAQQVEELRRMKLLFPDGGSEYFPSLPLWLDISEKLILKIYGEIFRDKTLLPALFAYEFRNDEITHAPDKSFERILIRLLINWEPKKILNLLSSDFDKLADEGGVNKRDLKIAALAKLKRPERKLSFIREIVPSIMTKFLTITPPPIPEVEFNKSHVQKTIKDNVRKQWPEDSMMARSYADLALQFFITLAKDRMDLRQAQDIEDKINRRLEQVLDTIEAQLKTELPIPDDVKVTTKDVSGKPKSPIYIPSTSIPQREDSNRFPRRLLAANSSSKTADTEITTNDGTTAVSESYELLLSDEYKRKLQMLHHGLRDHLEKDEGTYAKLRTRPFAVGELKVGTVSRRFRVMDVSYLGTQYRIAYQIKRSTEGNQVILETIASRENAYNKSSRLRKLN